MKSKKGIIILSTVVIACAVGFIVSPLVNWSVDESNASGDIAKSSRFSRKTAAESLTNMEELLVNDEEYKNRTIVAHVVMQTRARQFSNLANLSNEVAGGIPEFASVLKDLKEASVTADNACLALFKATNDINSALGGEACPDLAQNTINASLAYTALQKLNKLADRFIATTDNYLKKAEGDDRLKLIRDQWVEYQLLTAALDGDEKSAQTLKDKGYLLNSDQSAAALRECDSYPALCMVAENQVFMALQPDQASYFGEQFTDLTISDVFTAQDNVFISAVNQEEYFHDVMTELYSEHAGNVFTDLAGNVFPDLAGNVFSDLAGNVFTDLAGNVFTDLAGNVFSDLAGNVFSETATDLEKLGEVMQNPGLSHTNADLQLNL